MSDNVTKFNKLEGGQNSFKGLVPWDRDMHITEYFIQEYLIK